MAGLSVFLLAQLALLPVRAETPAEGEALFIQHCAECHGRTATVGLAGDIRGLSLPTVQGAVNGGPGEMPVVHISPADVEAIHAWLSRQRFD